MSVISFQQVSKQYQIKEVQHGFTHALHSFFHPTYRTVQAVQEVSFSLEPSGILGLIGENGAGKTTIIKMLCGILSPSSGEIEVLGKNPFQKTNEFKRQVSLMLGNKNQLWWDLPAHESFYLTKKLYGMSDTKYQAMLEELVEVLDISSFLNSPIKNLSLGQRMRCELVNALLFEPKLLLLDEPTLGLDIRSQTIIRSYVRQYIKSRGAACVITSHYMKDITDLTTEVVLLHHGKLIHSSTTADFITLCSRHSMIEIKGLTEAEIVRATNKNPYPRNDALCLFVTTEEAPAIMGVLAKTAGCTSVGIVEAGIEDLVENKVLSMQYE